MNKAMMTMALWAPVMMMQGTVVINETWTDGERVTQDLVNNSMAWYSSSSSSSVAVATGALTLTTGGSGRHVMAYFTDAGSPVTLAAGETLLVRFVARWNDATPPMGTGNDFRMGVWDSHSSRVSADSTGGTGTSSLNPVFEPYTGYAFTGGVVDSRPFALRKRDAQPAGGGILIGSTAVYTALGSTSNTGHTSMVPGVDYTGRLMIDNTGSGVIVTYSMDIGTTNYVLITRTDATAAHVSFDTVAFLVGSNVMDSFTLKQVEISKVASPSTPAITGEVTGGNMVVTCASQTGFMYQLEQSSSLSENGWLGTAINQAGTGSDLTFTLTPPAAGEKKFYRVVPTVNP